MKTLANMMKNYWFCYSIVGQCPLSIRGNETAPSQILKFYNILLVFVHIGVTGFVSTTELKHGDGFYSTAVRATPFIGLTLVAASILVPTFKTDVLCNVQGRFDTIDRHLRKIGYEVSESKTSTVPLVILSAHLLFISVIVALEFVYPFWTIGFPRYSEYFFWACYIMALIAANSNTYAFLLIQRFRYVNTKITELHSALRDRSPSSKCDVTDLKLFGACWEKYEKELFPTHKSRVQPVKTVTVRSDTTNESLKTKIKLLQKSHFELCQICFNLGALFTPPVVVTVLYTGMELLITSYTALSMILYHQDTMCMMHLIICIKWVLVDIIRILSILLAFTSIEKEGNQTPGLVHGLLLETDSLDIQNELLKFSQQLTHQKLNFSTCGLFSLDLSLLVSVAGAITTYLVILLQFNNSNAN